MRRLLEDLANVAAVAVGVYVIGILTQIDIEGMQGKFGLSVKVIAIALVAITVIILLWESAVRPTEARTTRRKRRRRKRKRRPAPPAGREQAAAPKKGASDKRQGSSSGQKSGARRDRPQSRLDKTRHPTVGAGRGKRVQQQTGRSGQRDRRRRAS